MTKDVTTSLTRRTVMGGVAGMLVVALGAANAVGAATASTKATMPPAAEATVANAVATAEAAHAAEIAAAEAARAAEEAAAAARAAQLSTDRQAVVDLAKAQVGDAYRLGASGPNVFDCSGLVMWVYRQAMGVSLPHNTHAQWNAISDTWRKGEREPQPGDVVFFFNNGANHVGLYIGNGMMVNAENPRNGVKIASINEGYWANKVSGFGRIIH